MAFRIPQVSQQAGSSVQLQAPGVVPVQSQAGNQLQQQGRALEGVGAAVMRLGDDIQDREDTARVTEMDSLLADYTRSRLSPVDGYRSQAGKSAMDGYEQVVRDIEEKRSEFLGKLKPGRQQDAFRNASNQRLLNARGIIDGHAAVQSRVDMASQQSAAIKGYQADYLENLGNPNEMKRYRELMLESVSGIGESIMADGATSNSLRAESLNGLHGAAVESFLEKGMPSGAEAYLKQYGGEMEPELRRKLSGVVKQEVSRQWAESETSGVGDNEFANARILRGIDGKLRRGEIGTDRHAMALRLADQRIKAVQREKDLVTSEAIAIIRGVDPDTSFSGLTSEQREVIDATGLREVADNYWTARRSGAPAPALDSQESEMIVSKLGLMDARSIKQIFTEKTTAGRYRQIAGVIGVDWQKHETRIKGILDNAFGEKTPEAAINAASTELRQRLGTFEWAHVKGHTSPTGNPVPRKYAPLDERVIRAAESRILQRLQDDPKLSVEEVMNDLNDIIVDSSMFTMSGATDGEVGIPAALMTFVHPDDRMGSTLVGSPEINPTRWADLPNRETESTSMPSALFDYFAKGLGVENDGTMRFDNLHPKEKQQKTIDFVDDWVSLGRPRNMSALQQAMELQRVAGGNEPFKLLSRTTPVEVKAQAAKYVEGDDVTIPPPSTRPQPGYTVTVNGFDVASGFNYGTDEAMQHDKVVEYLKALKQAQATSGTKK